MRSRLARRPIASRELALGAAIASLGAVGALPGARGASDPLALAAWLAIAAAPAGFLAGASRLPVWPPGLLAPAAWMGLFAFVDGFSPRDVPSPAWAALAWTALYVAGLGLGRRAEGARFVGACALLLAGAAASALPLWGAFARAPLSAPVAARALDLSPAVFVLECAGVDLARHPAVYDAAATVDIDPSLRTPWRGSLASPLALVLGCALAWLLARRPARSS